MAQGVDKVELPRHGVTLLVGALASGQQSAIAECSSTTSKLTCR